MEKEKIITIIIGLLAGLVLAGGYFFFSYYLPLVKNKEPNKKIITVEDQKPASENGSFLIETPQDNVSTQEAQIQVTGNAPAGSKIMIFANAEEKIASSNGMFTTSVKLEDGENTINVILLSDKPQIITRNVVLEIKQ